MRILLIIIILLVLGGVAIVGGVASYLSPDEPLPAIPAPSAVRSIGNGELAGTQGGPNAHAWLGIPYAQPPLDDLRWQAPRAARPWDGRPEFVQFKQRCPQLPVLSGAGALPVGDEDCLYLNVWAPLYHADRVPAGDERRPVMVWLHGGGNSLGGSDFPVYDGAGYAAEHDVIVVSMNYRLGPLGWFRHEALRQDDATANDNSGNFGTLDIIQALHWVRSNISAFGGDPDNVTLFGESSGGNNVLTMMASPLATGLFHRAIVQSAAFEPASNAVAENLRDDPLPGSAYSSGEILIKLLRSDGLASDRQTAKSLIRTMPREDLARYLRSKTIREIFAQYEVRIAGMLQMPLLFGDGHVLPSGMSAQQIFSSEDNYNQVPVILGANRDEMKLFVSLNPGSVRQQFGLPIEIIDVAAFERDSRYASDAFRAKGVDELASILHGVQGDSVWAYRFDVDDWRNLGFIDLKQLLGAAHFLELPFVFGKFTRPGRIAYTPSLQEEYDILSNSVMSYWAEFAYEGNPGTGRSGKEVNWTPWQPAGASESRLLVLDTEVDDGIRMSSDRLSLAAVKKRFRGDRSFATDDERCQAYLQYFWDSFDAEEYTALADGACPDADADPRMF
jgi:para-nitrobenzyl esterase